MSCRLASTERLPGFRPCPKITAPLTRPTWTSGTRVLFKRAQGGLGSGTVGVASGERVGAFQPARSLRSIAMSFTPTDAYHADGRVAAKSNGGMVLTANPGSVAPAANDRLRNRAWKVARVGSRRLEPPTACGNAVYASKSARQMCTARLASSCWRLSRRARVHSSGASSGMRFVSA